jgi:hypothetical protein
MYSPVDTYASLSAVKMTNLRVICDPAQSKL